MSRFVDNRLEKLELPNGDWIKVKSQLSFAEIQNIQINNVENTNDISIGMSMVMALIQDWNFKDDDGKLVECNNENILKLDLASVNEIIEACQPTLDKINDGMSKKKSKTGSQVSTKRLKD